MIKFSPTDVLVGCWPIADICMYVAQYELIID